MIHIVFMTIIAVAVAALIVGLYMLNAHNEEVKRLRSYCGDPTFYQYNSFTCDAIKEDDQKAQFDKEQQQELDAGHCISDKTFYATHYSLCESRNQRPSISPPQTQ